MTSELLGNYPVQDVLFVIGCVVIWALGFNAGLHR